MGALLQLMPAVAFLVVIVVAGEVAWHYARWRRLHPGLDIGTTQLRLSRYWGLHTKGAGAAIAVALFAAAIAIGLANETLGGYLFFGLGIVALGILMTAYYVWRIRAIARRW